MDTPDRTSTTRRDALKIMGGATGLAAVGASGVLVVGHQPKVAHAQEGGFELPNPLEDPAFIEGPNGGPATPFNGHAHQGHDGVKDDTGNISGALETAGSIATTVGKLLNTVGAANLGGSLVTAGAVLQVASNLMELITGDPPKPYEEMVQFDQRVSQPMGMDDPVGAKVGLITQQSVFTAVTAEGLLKALERRGGALEAGDHVWAMAHTGVLVAARERMAIDLARVAAAIRATAQALQGAQRDVEVSAAEQHAVLAWLATPAMVSDISQRCIAAGLNEAEIEIGLSRIQDPSHFKGLPDASKPASQLMQSNAEALYAQAQQMHARASNVRPFW